MSYQRLSDVQVSPRQAMVFGITRLLIILLGLAGLALWVASAGSVSVASRLFGEQAGHSVGNVGVSMMILGAVGILVGIGVLLYMSRSLLGRLIILAVIASAIALAFVLPNPIGLVPATVLLIGIGGLCCLFLILTSVVT